ncbi:MAG: hypothetical protein ABIP74_05390 [Candidatus Saccharimonas sp.]
MLHIHKWMGTAPKDGISSWCNVQGLHLAKLPNDPTHYEFRFFVLSGGDGAKERRIFGNLTLPASASNAIYGGLQVFKARVDLGDDGSADLRTLFIEDKEYVVEPFVPTPAT